MNCVVCGREVPHRTVNLGGMHPWCSDPCGVKWRTRNNFLFNLGGKSTLSHEQILGMVIDKGYLDDAPDKLGVISTMSKTIRPLAKEHELGSQFHSAAVHQQQQGFKNVTTTSTQMVPIPNKFVKVEKVTKAGKPYFITVQDRKEVTTSTISRVPNIFTQNISPDQMLEIALMAYNTAIGLKAKNKCVILYRVDSKGLLTRDERNAQTLSSSVHASVGNTEVWPLQKTAAWIQGAMRARISFILLDDPRGNDILIGGINKSSDAVYVRELHQITSMHYTIGVATNTQRPTNVARCFVLTPPAKTIGPTPLVPKEHWDHTWNSAQSNLKIGDTPGLIRDHLRKLFVDAGKTLPLAEY